MNNDNKVHVLKSVYNKLAVELKLMNENLNYGADANEVELAELEALKVSKRNAALAVVAASV